jgi:hypothetical protein
MKAYKGKRILCTCFLHILILNANVPTLYYVWLWKNSQ